MKTLETIALWFGYCAIILNMLRVLLWTLVELMVSYRRVIRYYRRHMWATIAHIHWRKQP